MSDRYEDERGFIQDLLGPIDSVTHIRTVEGAIRGNHVHHRTMQWTLILSGSMLMVQGEKEGAVGPGVLVEEAPGIPHAWKALEDTECLVFTRGPRSGENYESDTERLREPLLS